MTSAATAPPMSSPVQTAYPLSRNPTHGLLIEQAFRAGQFLPWHDHNDAYLSLVSSGAYREIRGSGSHCCARGTAVFHPAGESHCDEFSAMGGRVINVTLPGPVIQGAIGSGVLFDSSQTFADWPVPFLLLSLARLVREEQPGWQSTAHDHVIELIGHIVDPVCRASQRPPQWLRSALAFIRRSFRQAIGLADVSLAVGVHPAHVAREFRRHVRMSVGDYVRSLRIAWACEELTRGHLPLVRIALDAGFYDQAHFCRAFRQECGVSPSQYRKSLGNVDKTAGTH